MFKIWVYFGLIWCLSFSIGYTKEFNVLGIGAPCMDILITVQDEYIESVGNKGGSQQADLEFIHKILNESESHLTRIAPGGSCANAIKGLAGFGHKCAFYGKTGKDNFGEQFVQNLHDWRIHPLISQAEMFGTQVCLCLITADGNRTMRCYPGASEDISSNDLNPDLFKNISLVVFEGYSLYLKDQDFVPNAMKHAKQQNAMVSLDLSSFELVKMFKDKIIYLLKNYVDVVFANADEVKALTGNEPYEGCLKLKELCKIAVVMAGKDGCYVGSGDKVIHCPAFPSNVVDTTGAGDLFSSGFLHGVLQNLPLEECAHYGNKAGAAVCEVIGAENSVAKMGDFKTKNLLY